MTRPRRPATNAIEPDQRNDHLIRERHQKMSRSAHAYVRGSTRKFYEWLESSAAKIPEGPPVWICGDCHMGNLGPLADEKGRVAVQIRDLDQTVVGNPAHDLIRLGLSLASAARGSDLPGVTTVQLLEHLVEGYELGLRGAASKGRPADWAPRPVRRLLVEATRRRWHHLAAERLDSVRPEVPLGRRFWAVSDEERTAIGALFEDPDVCRIVTKLQGRDDDARVRLVDLAYWVKGCSSLGRLRYAVMLEVGRGTDRSLCLMDVKEAVTAAAPRAEVAPDSLTMPRDNAVRVVSGARALSPNLGERMHAARLLDRAVVLRELMPQDLKLDIERLTQDEAMSVASYLAGVVGHAHRRQMDDDALASWQRELGRARTTTLDAPSWLWSSVVELIGIHEVAYLDHCRQYAWREAA